MNALASSACSELSATAPDTRWLVRVLGAHEGLFDAVVAVDVRAVDKTGNAVACRHIGGGGTNFVCQCDLVGDLGRILAVVALGAGIEAHRSQRLVGVLAGGNGLGVANGDLAVQIRDVGDGLDLGVGASARMITRSLTNISSRVSASTSSTVSASSMVPLEAVMSTSTVAPARICSTRSPDALNCVSAKVVPVCSV